MAIFIYLFMIMGIILILMGIIGLPERSGVRVELPKDPAQIRKTRPSLLSFIFPFSRYLLEKLGWNIKIKNKLDVAHVRFIPYEFFNLKLLLMIISGIAGFFILSRFEPLIILIAAAFGYILPDIWLKRKINKRKQEIKHFLPETVDLLGLCVEAGLDFTSALRWITEKKTFNNPMIEEWVFVLEEIKWGKSRAQALKDMAARLNIIEVSSLVLLLTQAEKMGTPVAEAFSMISEDTRLQRFREGERYAMKAPIKILIPLIFFILPVIAIIVGGPIILRFMQGSLIK